MSQLLTISGTSRKVSVSTLGLKVKTFRVAAVLVVLAVAGLVPARLSAEEEGVALAIVYDTSGSMKDSVRADFGGFTPKYIIANRALLSVVNQLRAYSTNSSGGSRHIEVGLFVFKGSEAQAVVPLGPIDTQALTSWANTFSRPNGNTPLGRALNSAAQAVLNSPLPRKHVLLLTDGINTAGPEPAAVLPNLQKQAANQGASLGVHFVAFDVAASRFAPIKQMGATVVPAADEAQLNSQLRYILERKILLEEEEPPQPKR